MFNSLMAASIMRSLQTAQFIGCESRLERPTGEAHRTDFRKRGGTLLVVIRSLKWDLVRIQSICSL